MPVITISRQVGSSGEEIAKRVCDHLGYSYFDKNLLVNEAIKAGLTEEEIVDFSEANYKTKNLLENLFSPGARIVVSTPIRAKDETGIEKRFIRHLDEHDCIDMIHTVIKAAYRQGNLVIVGRGGQVILQKKPDVLHVRITGPMDARIRRIIQEKLAWDSKQATRLIQDRDKATTEYLDRFFKVRWDDPTLYNLTIDTGEHDYDSAVDLIINAVEALPVAA